MDQQSTTFADLTREMIEAAEIIVGFDPTTFNTAMVYGVGRKCQAGSEPPATLLVQLLANQLRPLCDLVKAVKGSQDYFPEIPVDTILNLTLVPPPLHTRAAEQFEQGDWGGVLCLVDSRELLAFVFDNCYQLLSRGLYEAALLEAYIGAKSNHSNWTLKVIEKMFSFADRERLLAAGDPLPPGDCFTIYRGVSGGGHSRKVRGYSWTADFDKAVWFANRLDLSKPAVYQANVAREEIFAYSNQRKEKEFIVRPRSCKLVRSLEAAA
jgi:hypothetical protein